jgi:alpha-L-fucosidase
LFGPVALHRKYPGGFGGVGPAEQAFPASVDPEAVSLILESQTDITPIMKTGISTHLIISSSILLAGSAFASVGSIPSGAVPSEIVATETEPITAGKFQPTWESLRQYETPEWFRDAKFGLWAHWGPQCQPEAGDWYARQMYSQGHWQSNYHRGKYGHPSEFGFKDVMNEWKAEKWDPERLVKFYKECGAKYFFAMANHHDNLDLWDSEHHSWTSVRVGPKKNIIGAWSAAARRNGLPFGVSVHASRAWAWYETSQGSDSSGDKASVPYDGKLTKADGTGKWWEGLDPQELYAQNHTPSPDFQQLNAILPRWNWGNGSSIPDLPYCQSFYDRTAELIRKYQPDLIYFDDTALPLWPVSDAGLKIAAQFYDTNLAKSAGAYNGVLFGKVLTDDQLECMTWDIERGVPNSILPYPWQTCTCIGSWHYDRGVYDRNQYKDSRMVIHMLADIVSKNGNLLLNIPLRGDGSFDEKEKAVLTGIAAWMKVNSSAIYATRPWRVCGEGPAIAGAELYAQGFNEGKGMPFTADDVRYTVSKDGKTLNAIVMGHPDKPMRFEALGSSDGPEKVRSIKLLGSNGIVKWKQDADALTVEALAPMPTPKEAIIYQISL